MLNGLWAPRRAALRGHLARARDFKRRIDRGHVDSAATLAAEEELTRARVSQLLRLLKLSPVILADLEASDGTDPVPTEAVLRKLAGIRTPSRQEAEYQRLCKLELEDRKPETQSRRGRPPQQGIQHLLQRARRYHAMMTAGEARSLAEVGRIEGVTGQRIAQLLSLLQLAPEILAEVDRPADELPAGITEKRLRAVAKLRDRQVQLAAWEQLQDELSSAAK